MVRFNFIVEKLYIVSFKYRYMVGHIYLASLKHNINPDQKSHFLLSCIGCRMEKVNQTFSVSFFLLLFLASSGNGLLFGCFTKPLDSWSPVVTIA
jgi:hypothetical protein